MRRHHESTYLVREVEPSCRLLASAQDAFAAQISLSRSWGGPGTKITISRSGFEGEDACAVTAEPSGLISTWEWNVGDGAHGRKKRPSRLLIRCIDLQGEKSIYLDRKDGQAFSVLDSLGQDVLLPL